MPTYEYECKSCSHSFEVFQAMSEAALSSCPSCGGALRRLIGGGTGIIFKGSGFYKNDSRNSGSSTLGSTSKSSAASEGGSASEPAAASPSKAEPAKTAAPGKTAQAS